MHKRYLQVILLSLLFLSLVSAQEPETSQFGTKVSKNMTIYATDFLSASKIASYTGEINPDNICMSTGKFRNDPDWFVDVSGKMIRFVGEGSRDISFIVVCDRGDRILETIQQHPSTRMSLVYIDHCTQFFTDTEDVQCAVVLNSVTNATTEALPLSYIVLIAFAVLLIWPMVIVITSESNLMKLIYLFKVVIFAVILALFNFFGSEESIIFNLALLFFFFLQTNLSLAPFLLGLIEGEKKHVRLCNFAILGIEFTAVVFILMLIWQSNIFPV